MFWDRDSTSRFHNRGLRTDPEFSQWCRDHNCEVAHVYVDIPDDKTVTLFLLRWA
jgi:hypothetical protein